MRMLCLPLLLLSAFSAQGLEVTVLDEQQQPIPFAWCGLHDAEQKVVLASGTTNAAGEIGFPPNDAARFLSVVPPAAPEGSAFENQPRTFVLNGETAVTVSLPAASTYILHAYDENGVLMSKSELAARGELAGQVVHAIDADFISLPCARTTVKQQAPEGTLVEVPALMVAPEQTIGMQWFFWETSGYGKLLLRMDNAGKGYTLPRGAAQVLLVNVELARTAVADLERRAPKFSAEAKPEIESVKTAMAAVTSQATGAAKAKAADKVLADALRLRDDLEFERAKIEAAQQRDFLFGVYQGAPYGDSEKAWEAADKAGFDLATVLLGWHWTTPDKAWIEGHFGLPRLAEMFTLKAHGVCWVQDHPILPKEAYGYPKPRLISAALAHQQKVLGMFGDRLAIVEAVNEPANTNVLRVSREQMAELLSGAAKQIKTLDKPVLVNSPHDFSFGWQHMYHNFDGTPSEFWYETYLAFLRRMQAEGKLEDVDIVGLQLYPGAHFTDPRLVEAPCPTPSYLQDLFDIYARLGKRLHVTEFSIPSRFDDAWKCGYWRNKWDEQTQADYAERAVAIAKAHPAVDSFTWWDISDLKPSVDHGGMLHKDNTPKPVFEAVTRYID